MNRGVWIAVSALFAVMSAFALSVLLYRDVSLTSLQFPMRGNLAVRWDTPLTKEGRVRGTFTATENHLGTVAIRVRTFNRINNDIIVFQMREKGAGDWTVFNKYFTDRFTDDSLYPFGFPPISDSKGKTYEFEIYSVNGVYGNAIGFRNIRPAAVLRYTLPRAAVMMNKAEYVRAKTVNLFSSIPFVLLFVSFALPLWMIGWGLIGGKANRVHPGLALLPAIAYAISYADISGYVPLIYGALTAIMVRMRGGQPGYAFSVAMTGLVLTFVSYTAGFVSVANRLSVVSYVTLLAGLALFVGEYFRKGKIR